MRLMRWQEDVELVWVVDMMKENRHSIRCLSRMDGFAVNEGIIVMAATNRVDILDPAILRPGRFDRKVVVADQRCCMQD